MTSPSRRTTTPAPIAAALAAVALCAVLVGCSGPDPDALPSSPENPAVSPGSESTPEPSASVETPPEDDNGMLALPDCEGLYSTDLVTTLTDEGRELQGDTATAGGGGWGTGDPVLVGIVQGALERVSCTWILPFSESGSTTSVVRVDESTATLIDTHLTGTAGFAASSAAGGTLYTIDVGGDFPYSEAHLIVGEILIVTEAFGGDAEALTLDAASQLTAP